MRLRVLLITILAFITISFASAQKVLNNSSILNYQRGDHNLLHFGFTLGVNYMDYKSYLSGLNDWRVEGGKMNMGFLVGIVSELRITDDLALRCLPGLEFSTRRLVYTQTPINEDSEFLSTTIVDESNNDHVYITVPLMFKYKAKRINNYRPFITLGPCVKYDFQNHKKIEPDNAVFLRTKPWDYYLEMGIGSDFYLPYFKLGIELRLSLGLRDILIHEYDIQNPGFEGYTDALKKLKTRMFTLAFHFE
ncbi:MAG: PorT family protein [Culturomica sp.]|jgi:hypothetical protein|nr:PorT family protein [Culturomica sp.]